VNATSVLRWPPDYSCCLLVLDVTVVPPYQNPVLQTIEIILCIELSPLFKRPISAIHVSYLIIFPLAFCCQLTRQHHEEKSWECRDSNPERERYLCAMAAPPRRTMFEGELTVLHSGKRQVMKLNNLDGHWRTKPCYSKA